MDSEFTAEEAAMAKWWTTELQKRVVDRCLQIHGGYGYMMEYPIAADYADAAVQSIYAGTNEIMKVIIARRMGLAGGPAAPSGWHITVRARTPDRACVAR